MSKLKKLAKERLIIDGTNADDIKTYRPALKALKELEIYLPFVDFNITKEEIRSFAKENGIKNYNKPSKPCFATRFPYDTLLCEDLINIVKKGEKILKNYGFEASRFRLHNDIARIEIENKDILGFLEKKDKILNGENFTTRFKKKSLIKTSNLHNAFGSVDFLNSGMDNDGNLHLYMFDTYDFNANEGPLVEAGRRQMLKGNLKGNFSICDIVLTKDELDKIWKKK